MDVPSGAAVSERSGGRSLAARPKLPGPGRALRAHRHGAGQGWGSRAQPEEAQEGLSGSLRIALHSSPTAACSLVGVGLFSRVASDKTGNSLKLRQTRLRCNIRGNFFKERVTGMGRAGRLWRRPPGRCLGKTGRGT